MKYIILVGDGMADFPLAELGGKTPLEAAHTPAMDSLAMRGELHTLQTVPDGMSPGSDVANLSLLGYNPEHYYTGRAPLEAASLHVTLADHDTAFRCNLVTLAFDQQERPTMIDYSAGHISTHEAGELIAALAAELNRPGVTFYPGISYRHLLVINQTINNLITTPPHDHTDCDVTSLWNGYLTHPIFGPLVTKARTILADHPVNLARIKAGHHPANAIWLWGEGKSPSLPTMQSRFGISGALISAVDLLKGMGVYAGMEVINVPGATGYLDTNYQGKADAAIKALERHDLVFVHVEAPDEAGHQGLIKEKIQAIEDFDQKIVQPIINGMSGQDFRVAVTCDHYTPIALKTHVALPVPIALFDSRNTAPGCGGTYCEESANNSRSLLRSGAEFFATLLQR
ncbi:MAG: cofactor-independent phosphoglycerate mutase [Proteobacteria bacterium]|nr:cofactor-independent phosphoglycerate mutase [Desulfobulbaceae bacterium]MBU4152798.1 cofactor-independent phosphoglycerate mutase [Pseudomonadota bacterium]